MSEDYFDTHIIFGKYSVNEWLHLKIYNTNENNDIIEHQTIDDTFLLFIPEEKKILIKTIDNNIFELENTLKINEYIFDSKVLALITAFDNLKIKNVNDVINLKPEEKLYITHLCLKADLRTTKEEKKVIKTSTINRKGKCVKMWWKYNKSIEPIVFNSCTHCARFLQNKNKEADNFIKQLSEFDKPQLEHFNSVNNSVQGLNTARLGDVIRKAANRKGTYKQYELRII